VFKEDGEKEKTVHRAPEMAEVDLAADRARRAGKEARAGAEAAEGPAAPFTMVMHMHEVRSEANFGKRMAVLKVWFRGGKRAVSAYLDFGGEVSPGLRRKAARAWRLFGGGEPVPGTAEEAVARRGELRLPPELTLRRDDRWQVIAEIEGPRRRCA
jgi:hypothetical protein